MNGFQLALAAMSLVLVGCEARNPRVATTVNTSAVLAGTFRRTHSVGG